MLAYDVAHPHGTLIRRNTSLSTATPFPLPLQSQWNPGDIGTLVFGCIASVLGLLALWATFWLGRRRALREVGDVDGDVNGDGGFLFKSCVELAD